ncbi:MAG: branched-chain amino acid ABC transporter permease [Pseudomonadota bacterium]|jgi:branched-chain amino acid transport system permease protein|uniref:Leucine/isoleucine/valine transporter permease subunit n=1 Tax=Thalassovita autumnalis TaxID=2072972 RepID=A0A0P1G8Q4_9RHOB|nr:MULTISPECIES: branched-chain amino acid ABC transporter permease [Thalassovita]MEC7963815.1 branched-chain amino acid ABC transporter permease [Pseudomonadota bacterium]MEC8039259.1 branched-chain amino acid ABC transporter permease [Pseudomonadota bacterium]MEC8295856.1 branched-chain amino acid ABC transporter permease [Pseudomonadota bacterium]CUH64983.1 leucine/isoleucine/valine transporter permease subunit [Thalassovita autumnalis]CUH71158.1 leucine/isoleucine/valine transporter permea
MFYREAGDFKTTYADDNQTFPIKFDRYRYYAVLFFAFLIVPFVINDYWVNAVFMPFLIYSIAAIGLNILVGYCGQVSLGTGGFMAVGAYAVYKLMTAFPEVSIFIHILLAGGVTSLVGVAFGLPSLRIKGFYLAVATLAAQFFLVWLFNKVPWFYNYSASGQISAPERTVFGIAVTGPNTAAWATYLFCLIFVTICALIARNLTRGTTGRKWMAIRDMDIAAEIIGVDPLKSKLSAFAVSSFFIGVSGALFFSVYLGAVEVGEVFGINKSFLVLFMIIIGGLGSIFGSFAGAAFLVLLPVLLKNVLVGMLGWPTDLAAHLEFMIVGALIIIFLIAEPHGLAQLWRVAKEKLRLWPFPH